MQVAITARRDTTDILQSMPPLLILKVMSKQIIIQVTSFSLTVE